MELISKIQDAKKRLSGPWAMEESHFQGIVTSFEDFKKNPKAYIINIHSDEDGKVNPEAFSSLFSVEPQDLLSINGSEAVISITGPLVDVNDCASAAFGCTSYEDIVSAIEKVENMEDIDSVIFNIDSPGGMVHGVDTASIAIKNMKKKTESRTAVMAASAAYWLASQCDSMTATCATAQFGSIGVVIEYWSTERAMTEAGLDKVCITSTNAPEKRVDALTDSGRKKIKADLDGIEDIFLRRIADGRGVTVSEAKNNFGRGGMFLAEKSLEAGMIDKTEFILNNNIDSTTEDNISAESEMNLKEFLESNPSAQTEVNSLVKSSVDASEKASSEKEEERKITIDKASKYLASSYDNKIQCLAAEVIKGEKRLESLETVVAILDKDAESKSSEAAQEETNETAETTPYITTEADKVEEEFNASVARAKELM